MTSRDEIPPEVRRMRTSDLVRFVAANLQHIAAANGWNFTRAGEIQRACAAELDARIPPREVKP